MTFHGKRITALLALTQAATLIDHVASTGTVDHDAMAHLLDCLFGVTEPDIMGLPDSPAAYEIGHRTLVNLLNKELPGNQREIPNYMRGMVKVERELLRRPETKHKLTSRLYQAHALQKHFSTQPGTVYAAVAGVYGDTLAQLNLPFWVTGAWQQIINERNGNIIRTAILGGVQAAAYWRRAGGRLWQLRLGRKRLLRELDIPA